MTPSGAPVGPYPLPPLRFGYADLAPVIGEASLRRHHDVHHRASVDAVNAALAKHPDWYGLTIEALLRRLPEVPDDIRDAVRDAGGGHANHQFFWKIVGPDGARTPSGALAHAIDAQFGSFAAFKQQFEDAGNDLAGPGWVFLITKPADAFALEIVALPQNGSVLERATPSLGLILCDLWEHAYDAYPDRAGWLRAFWNIVDWTVVDERFQVFREGTLQV